MQFINLCFGRSTWGEKKADQSDRLNQGCTKTALDHVGSGSGRGQGSSCPETAEQACGVKAGSISFVMIS